MAWPIRELRRLKQRPAMRYDDARLRVDRLDGEADVSKDGGKPPHSRKTGTAILVMRW